MNRNYWKFELVRREYYFLKDENGSGKHIFLYDFYFSCLPSSLVSLFTSVTNSLATLSSFVPNPHVSYRSETQTKNDENLFCLLLFIGGKLLEGPPCFSQWVYTIYFNKCKKAYLDSFDFFRLII